MPRINTGFQARSYKHLVPQLRKMMRLQADGLRAGVGFETLRGSAVFFLTTDYADPNRISFNRASAAFIPLFDLSTALKGTRVSHPSASLQGQIPRI